MEATIQTGLAISPAYGMVEAAFYLRLPYQTVRGWVSDDGVVRTPSEGRLSYANLLELHVLKALRKVHGLTMQSIRRGLSSYALESSSDHPLLDVRLRTDGYSLILQDGESYLNLSRNRQLAMKGIISIFLQRIEPAGFFPFVVSEKATEPRNILITPQVAFGKPVLAGTGILAEVIAGRFAARDSIEDLSAEYGIAQSLIEEAIRWEMPHLHAAA